MKASEYWFKHWQIFNDMNPDMLSAVEIGLKYNMEYRDWLNLFCYGANKRYDNLFRKGVIKDAKEVLTLSGGYEVVNEQ